jgi:hypothetical protein
MVLYMPMIVVLFQHHTPLSKSKFSGMVPYTKDGKTVETSRFLQMNEPFDMNPQRQHPHQGIRQNCTWTSPDTSTDRRCTESRGHYCMSPLHDQHEFIVQASRKALNVHVLRSVRITRLCMLISCFSHGQKSKTNLELIGKN